MKKRFMLTSMLLAIGIGLMACGNNGNNIDLNQSLNKERSQATEKVESNTQKEEEANATAEVEVVAPTEEKAITPADVKGKKLPKGVYVVGDYIKPGEYVFRNETENKYLKVVMFSSEANYDAYIKAESFTVGEEAEAIEKNAWQDVYIKSGEAVYMNLEKGSVLTVSDAEVMMDSVVIADLIGSEEAATFDKALFVVGKDIAEGQYVFDCVETESYSTEILVFESTDTYTAYHTTSRFTIGEEQDAIDANSKTSAWIQKDKSFSTYLKEGNIVIVDGGYLKISIME